MVRTQKLYKIYKIKMCNSVLFGLSHHAGRLFWWCVCLCVKSLSCVRLFVTPWTVACHAPLSRQEYWSGLPFPSPENGPKPRIKPRSPALQADSLSSEPPGKLLMKLVLTNNWFYYIGGFVIGLFKNYFQKIYKISKEIKITYIHIY